MAPKYLNLCVKLRNWRVTPPTTNVGSSPHQHHTRDLRQITSGRDTPLLRPSHTHAHPSASSPSEPRSPSPHAPLRHHHHHHRNGHEHHHHTRDKKGTTLLKQAAGSTPASTATTKSTNHTRSGEHDNEATTHTRRRRNPTEGQTGMKDKVRNHITPSDADAASVSRTSAFTTSTFAVRNGTNTTRR